MTDVAAERGHADRRLCDSPYSAKCCMLAPTNRNRSDCLVGGKPGILSKQKDRRVRVMQESDTYLMILDEGKEKQAKKDILLVGEERLGPANESIKTQLEDITDLERLDR
ncbi:MAG TPA: hypothetical protein VMV69_25560, partial [Pirellulales bacterium]|nr:hypothetical protein [Pirellulales bacterium]